MNISKDIYMLTVVKHRIMAGGKACRWRIVLQANFNNLAFQKKINHEPEWNLDIKIKLFQNSKEQKKKALFNPAKYMSNKTSHTDLSEDDFYQYIEMLIMASVF